LEILLYPNISKVGLAAYFAEVAQEGSEHNFDQVCYRAKIITMKAKPKQLAIADNHMLGKGKLKIKVHKQALRVMVNHPVA
jgi:diacylglycerol kinase family enzyme